MENCLFVLDDNQGLGEALAKDLDLRLIAHEVQEFENGEMKVRSSEALWSKRVFLTCSLYGDRNYSVNDKLCRLLFFIDSLKDSGASRVELLIPHLCYSRKDRRDKPQDPVCTRSLAKLLESVRADSVWTLDVHNRAAFENAYRIPAFSLDTQSLFIEHFSESINGEDVAVISPDSGGVKRSERFRIALQKKLQREISKGFMEKLRTDDKVWGHTLVGEVQDKVVILFDDLISSGTTLQKAAQACMKAGAKRVLAGASHGVFEKRANTILADEALSEIAITDSIPPFKIDSEKVKEKLTVLSSARVWEEALSVFAETP